MNICDMYNKIRTHEIPNRNTMGQVMTMEHKKSRYFY